jgi:hypothetical protein
MKKINVHLLLLIIWSYSTPSLATWKLVEHYKTTPHISSVQKHTDLVKNYIANNVQSNDSTNISTSKASYGSHEVIDFTYNFINKSNSDNVAIELLLPEGNQFIADETFITLSADQVTINPQPTFTDNGINWQGTLTKPKLSFTPFDNSYFGYIPLNETFNTKAQACAINCENNIWWWDFSFTFQGKKIDRFYISKQGEVFFTQDRNTQASSITPLFTPDSTHNSAVRFAEIISTNDNGNNKVYLVIEWTHFSEQNDNEDNIEQRYQLIIEEFTANIWFNYLDVNTLDNTTVAKAQNETGQVSFDILATTAKYLIADKNPQNNATFLILNEPGNAMQLNSNIQVNKLSSIMLEQYYTTQEDEALTIEIPVDNLQGTLDLLHYNSNKAETLTETISVYFGSENEISIQQKIAPSKGELQINTNELTYTPSPNKNGIDNFTINIQDSYVESNR